MNVTDVESFKASKAVNKADKEPFTYIRRKASHDIHDHT